MINFIYSEKASKFCEISTLLLFYVVPVKSKVKISKKFVTFSEYMNFTIYMAKDNNLSDLWKFRFLDKIGLERSDN